MTGYRGDSRRMRLNRGRRFGDDERARIGNAISAHADLIRRHIRWLPRWLRRRHGQDAAAAMLIEAMWAAADHDPARCGIGDHLEIRLQYFRKTLVRHYARRHAAARREEPLREAELASPAPAPWRAAEDREMVAAVLAVESASHAARREGRGGTGRVGLVLRERFLLGLLPAEIAARRGTTRQAVQIALAAALARTRTFVEDK